MDLPIQRKDGFNAQIVRRRIDILKGMIKQRGNEKYDKLIAEFRIREGLSERKAKEYLKLLIDVEFAKVIKKEDIKLIQYNGS